MNTTMVPWWAIGGRLIMFAFALALLAGLGILVFMALRALLKAGRSGSLADDETQILMDIHQEMTRLDERVDALETLLVNRDSRSARASESQGINADTIGADR